VRIYQGIVATDPLNFGIPGAFFEVLNVSWRKFCTYPATILRKPDVRYPNKKTMP
jgi:hypothetical protein